MKTKPTLGVPTSGCRGGRLARAAWPALALGICLTLAACGRPEIVGRWRDRAIAVDGDYRDWAGALFHFEDERIYAGVLRDETRLYLCLSSSDRQRIGQVLRGGLTVWFDRTGEERRAFGVRFPIPAVRPEPPPDPGQGGGEPFGVAEGDLEALVRRASGADREIEILRESSPPIRLFLAEATGTDAQIGMIDDVFTYELAIPLVAKPEFAYAIGTELPQTLSIGLETTALDLSRFRGLRLGDAGGAGEKLRRPPPGGPGGGGRGGSGPRGGIGRSRQGAMQGLLELWVRVKLAGGPDS